jgi:radical SAM protein with 4Fe4S-binding SPASM domain
MEKLKINNRLLVQNNIFAAHLRTNRYILYSPLSKHVLLATNQHIDNMEEYLLSHTLPENNTEIIETLTTMLNEQIDVDDEKLGNFNLSDINRMAILPTFNCNFSCSYCYSAKGRSTATIRDKQIISALDYFINPTRTVRRNLYITILGGGEPLLAKEKIALILKHADYLAQKRGFKIEFGLTTNGSMIDDTIIHLIKKYKVDVGVSFEILEKLQNTERGHYQQVFDGLQKLLSASITPEVKPIIKIDNVALIPQMVTEVITKFPQIKKLKLQPIDSNTYFPTQRELREFYEKFFREMMTVSAKTPQLTIYSTMLGFGLNLKDHYCGGELCLAPTGLISACHRFSSEKDDGFENLRIGNIIDNKVVINKNKYTTLMRKNSMLQDNCQNCIAKFHCSSGCLAQKTIYNPSMFDEICHFNRKLITHLLAKQLKNADLLELKKINPNF